MEISSTPNFDELIFPIIIIGGIRDKKGPVKDYTYENPTTLINPFSFIKKKIPIIYVISRPR